MLAVDAGGSLSAKDLTNLAVARTKAELMARAYRRGGIDGMALSERDWRLGADFVLGLGTAHDLPLLAANLSCEGGSPLPASRVVSEGGLRIGIVGLTDGVVPGCTIEPGKPAAERALAELGEVDLSLILSPLPRTRTLELVDVADVVVMTSSSARVSLGRSLPVGVVARGKSLGVLDITGEGRGLWSVTQEAALKDELARIERDLGAMRERSNEASEAEKARAERRVGFAEGRRDKARKALSDYGTGDGARRATLRMIELSDEVADHPEVAGWVTETLAAMEAAAGLPIPDDAPRLVSRSAYAGSDACLGCHPAQHAQWSATPHATAWASLRDDQHGRDPACVGCHVTGWNQDGGPAAVEAITPFRGVQCEACHGPAAAHARQPTRTRPVRNPEPSTCTACHDGERDGGRFDPVAYRAKVIHTAQHEASPEVSPEVAPAKP